MKKRDRRTFIKDIVLAGGAVTIAADALNAFSLFDQQGKKRVVMVEPKNKPVIPSPIDFRYSPSSWQSTFCFPDDPSKSLVGKFGELLYGHPGLGADIDAFAQKVWFGIKGTQKGEYIEQKFENPSIPIFTTKLKFPEMTMVITTFATNHDKEGRVDNALVEITSPATIPAECMPMITVTTKEPLEIDDNGSDFSTVLIGEEQKRLFFAVNAKIELIKEGDEHRFILAPKSISSSTSYTFFARFPVAGQDGDAVEDGMELSQQLLSGARSFWQGWKPYDGTIAWQVQEEYSDFLISSTRNILQSRTIKNGKKAFQVGPTCYRGLWVIDGTFLLEAARYLGYDKEAQEGLESIWDLQTSAGGIFAGGGESHWKDTAAAVYMLIRQAELAQDWRYFNELWPDMHKAMMFLRNLRDKAYQDGTPNGKYGLLPEGFGDSGIGGVRPELTNTMWTLIALRSMVEVGDRLFMAKKDMIREFYRELWIAYRQALRDQLRDHPGGFKYLPMLMKEDPRWNDPEVMNRPQVQAAQIYLSHAIYPGLLYKQEDEVVLGHVNLMKSIMKEDIPAETGWLAHDAVWPYNAPIFGQVLLWLQQPALARQVFNGFLNHASPLQCWREEQTLRSVADERFIGDMPHNWASAEAIRFLRHSLILEDEMSLCLFDGLLESDLDAKKPFSLTSSPTRWGRITLTLEPLDDKAWRAKFKRENYDERKMPKLNLIEFRRKLSSRLQLDKVTGTDVEYHINGGRVLVAAGCDEWEAVWRVFGRSK